MRTAALLLLATLTGCAAPASAAFEREAEDPPVVATFSIVARDPANGDLGIAVASKFLAVGAVVPWAEAGKGAVATQAWANTRYGPLALEHMAQGKSAAETLQLLIEADPQSARRQVGLVDREGRAATHTGTGCLAWAGGYLGKGYTCQGNILTGPEVVEAMAKAFEAAKGELADRLLDALLAGDRAGGDKRGRQSAAVFVVRAEGGYSRFNDRYLDLRVDDHTDPVKELQRLNELHRRVWRRPARPAPAPEQKKQSGGKDF